MNRVTEAAGGSDVASLECTAEESPDGRYFIVNG